MTRAVRPACSDRAALCSPFLSLETPTSRTATVHTYVPKPPPSSARRQQAVLAQWLFWWLRILCLATTDHLNTSELRSLTACGKSYRTPAVSRSNDMYLARHHSHPNRYAPERQVRYAARTTIFSARHTVDIEFEADLHRTDEPDLCRSCPVRLQGCGSHDVCAPMTRQSRSSIPACRRRSHLTE